MLFCIALITFLHSSGQAATIRHKGTLNRFTHQPIERSYAIFTAYNDFSWASGQLSSNITLYEKDQSGFLKKYATGQAVPVSLALVGGGLVEVNRTQGAIASSNTEGYALFNGMVTCTGVWSYDVADATITLTGMDPRLNYEVVVFGNRDDVGMVDRLTTMTISDVSSFRNTSTPGASFSGEADPAVTIANGYNRVTGYVARFTDMKPGDDGDALITISSPTNKYYLNAIMLTANRYE